MEDQLITPDETKQAAASPNGSTTPQISPQISSTKPKKTGSSTLVLVAILMLILGAAIGYFVTKTYFPKIVTETIEVPIVGEESVDTTPAAQTDANWKEESKKTVDAYLGYFSVGGTTIPGVQKPATCEPGVSTIKCTSLKTLLSSKFANYLACLVGSPQANNVESGMMINYNPVIGGQDAPKSHEILNAVLQGDKVSVITKLNYDKPVDLNFYLINENGKWLINATDVSNKFNASEYGCSQYATK